MLSLLMHSKTAGNVGPVSAVRNHTHISVRGMEEGDLLHANDSLVISENGDYFVPPGEETIQITHTLASGNPVFVELIHGPIDSG